MFKRFSTANWPFALKFAIPSLLALLIVGFVEYISLSALHTVRSSLYDVVERKYRASVLLEQSVNRLRAVNGEVYLLQVKKEAGIEQDVKRETKRLTEELGLIAKSLTDFKTEYAGPKEIEQIDKILQNVHNYSKAVTFVGSMLDIDFKATVTFIMPLRGAYEDMIGNLSSISSAFLVASQEASMKANELAIARTRLIFIFSIIAFALTLAIMIPLAYSTTRSIKALAAATVRLADGDTQIDFESLERHDELGRLVKALTVFRDNIERVVALKKVSLLYASMNAMLDSLPQGLFTFGPDGICSDNCSKACTDLLKYSPAGRPLAEVLHLTGQKQSSLDDILPLIFGDSNMLMVTPKTLLDMLPKYFYEAGDSAQENRESAISLEYRPIMNAAGKIQSVLVIATDHSDEIEAARQNRERQDSVLRILRILSSRNLFIRFFHSITDYFADPQKMLSDSTLDQFKRDVHSFKGAAGIYYFNELVNALHDVESALPAETNKKPQIVPPLSSALAAVSEALSNAKTETSKILGDDFELQGMVRTIPMTTLKAMANTISPEQSIKDIRQIFIQLLMGESIQKLLANTQAEIRELAERYGKNIELGKIEGEDFSIITEVYASAFSTFTHIGRNIIAHAVEEPEIRRKFGKPQACTVTMTAEKFKRADADWFRLTFADDGGGIDSRRLKDILLGRGGNEHLFNETHDEILQHIFDDNVSTTTNVTKLGGRGVGMSAVKQAVEEVGGNIRVESVLHYSTKIIIEMPFVWTV